MNKILKIDNIFKNYKQKQVINGVSFSVKQGEVIGLLGPNGAGKTTCFYMIAGLVNVSKGKIFIDNIDITNLPMHQRASLGIGYLPQEVSIFRGMNVEDNIMSVLEIIIEKKQARLESLEKLLDEFSIQHIRKSHALALSGGERRRVEIARALATNPLFILLDEPFAGVDPIAINDIRQMITHLKDRGIGVLITDHNVRETLSIVDKGYIVYDGKILASGTKDEIINHQDVKRVYLGDSFSVN
ncbi:MAG: LPS export ABC transporter ATP-binding protein [Rickettsiales bacterium]|jgi:lipopolysaccharide export system ATP-binding protein|nr:LPS export ABC transporter ATP-binding protein [Rickettsiales bacterium]|tara:strand:- start:4113 stop:4841 length:729 start_codon:yes stop_codon:yes gene_type:complete